MREGTLGGREETRCWHSQGPGAAWLLVNSRAYFAWLILLSSVVRHRSGVEKISYVLILVRYREKI
jgi:hypothetical protein